VSFRGRVLRVLRLHLFSKCLALPFLSQLDPRIWNSQDVLDANVPAAGGRFSAAGLAHFYHDLWSEKILNKEFLNQIQVDPTSDSTSPADLQAMMNSATNANNATGGDDLSHTSLSMGYQLIRTDRDAMSSFSGLGHAGVGGSIAFIHRPTGTSIAVMLNKADGGQAVTERILRVIADHYDI